MADINPRPRYLSCGLILLGSFGADKHLSQIPVGSSVVCLYWSSIHYNKQQQEAVVERLSAVLAEQKPHSAKKNIIINDRQGLS